MGTRDSTTCPRFLKMGFKVTELAWPLFKHDCDIAMLKPPFLVFIQNNSGFSGEFSGAIPAGAPY